MVRDEKFYPIWNVFIIFLPIRCHENNCIRCCVCCLSRYHPYIRDYQNCVFLKNTTFWILIYIFIRFGFLIVAFYIFFQIKYGFYITPEAKYSQISSLWYIIEIFFKMQHTTWLSQPDQSVASFFFRIMNCQKMTNFIIRFIIYFNSRDFHFNGWLRCWMKMMFNETQCNACRTMMDCWHLFQT